MMLISPHGDEAREYSSSVGQARAAAQLNFGWRNLILGGAALQRCDNRYVSITALAAGVM
jgi:hypothetical protein